MFSYNKKKFRIAQILSVEGRAILVEKSRGLMVISRKQMLTNLGEEINPQGLYNSRVHGNGGIIWFCM